MPELPEVETTRRGLAPHLEGRRVHGVILRRPDLRWPIPEEIGALLPGQAIEGVRRRAKYLLLDTAIGSALLHLGMSGSLRVLPGDTPVRAHDHVDISLDNGRLLRFNDPRRFGSLLWQPAGENPRTAGRAGSGAARRRLRWRLPVPAQPGAQGTGEDLPDGPGHRGRGGQHLRRRKPVHGRHQPAARGREDLARALPAPGRCREADPGLRHHPRRHHPARFHQPGRGAGLFRAGTAGLRREGEPCRQCGRLLRHATIGQRASVWCGYCQR